MKIRDRTSWKSTVSHIAHTACTINQSILLQVPAPFLSDYNYYPTCEIIYIPWYLALSAEATRARYKWAFIDKTPKKQSKPQKKRNLVPWRVLYLGWSREKYHSSLISCTRAFGTCDKISWEIDLIMRASCMLSRSRNRLFSFSCFAHNERDKDRESDISCWRTLKSKLRHYW